MSRLALRFALAAMLLLAVAPAQAATGEFRAGENGLTCIGAAAQETGPYGACLRIGPLHVGQSFRDVSMILGKAAKQVTRGAVVERVYPIRIDVPQGQPVPYWVVGVEDQRVVFVQLTGTGGVRHAFSSLRLGDASQRVLQVLGEPSVRQDAPRPDSEYWGYGPAPVWLEIRAGRLYSMRVSEK